MTIENEMASPRASQTHFQDGILYRCMKNSNEPKLLGKTCKWTGSSLDYLAHIKEKHPESCFGIEKKKFCLTVPKYGQTGDKGIFTWKSVEFLYEILLDAEHFYFSLTTNSDSCYKYRLLLGSNSFEEHSNHHINNSPLVCRKHKIVIPNYVLYQHADAYGRFKWKVNVLDP